MKASLHLKATCVLWKLLCPDHEVKRVILDPRVRPEKLGAGGHESLSRQSESLMKYWSHLQLYHPSRSSVAGFAETSGHFTPVLTQCHGLQEGPLGKDKPLGKMGAKDASMRILGTWFSDRIGLMVGLDHLECLFQLK